MELPESSSLSKQERKSPSDTPHSTTPKDRSSTNAELQYNAQLFEKLLQEITSKEHWNELKDTGSSLISKVGEAP